jgi:hypothetical protein
MPPSRPIPSRRFVTDEPTLAIQPTGAAYCRRHSEGSIPNAPCRYWSSITGLGRQYLSLETSPGKIFAAYLARSSGRRPDCSPQEFFGATSRIIDARSETLFKLLVLLALPRGDCGRFQKYR